MEAKFGPLTKGLKKDWNQSRWNSSEEQSGTTSLASNPLPP
jgi:hypothetical protein